MLLAILAVLCLAVPAFAEKPNILFIMSDDHTAQAVGAYATLLKDLDPTPTIDTLAKEGICFDNAFCTNGICTPSRACIITGQYNHVNGVFDLDGSIAREKQTLPIAMKAAGYQTAMIGKWHLKVEPNFDYYKVLPSFVISTRRRTITSKAHLATTAIWLTLRFLSQRRFGKYPRHLVHWRPEVSKTNLNRTSELRLGGRRNPRRSYAHGLPKQFPKEFRWAYDESQRMPFIARYPKSIKPGTRSDAIIENVDYPAMMLDFAEAKIPDSMQGKSFRSICETGKEPDGWKQAAYYRYWMHMAHHDNPGEMAIRTKTHKLIYFYGCNYEGKEQTPQRGKCTISKRIPTS